MDHHDIEEQQVAERYLMGKLSAEETAGFEEHYLTCQECLDRLELAERFDRALKGVAAEDAARSTVAARVGILAALARLSRSRQASVVLAAVLVLVILPIGLLVRQIGRLDRELDRTRATLSGVQINTHILRLSPERSGPDTREPVSRITLSSVSEWIVLELDLGVPEYGSYQATVIGPDGELTWQADGLEPNYLDALVISLHSTSLEAGDYRLRLAGVPPQREGVPVASFSFRVIR